jgi:valyl-tRNA synthetase
MIMLGCYFSLDAPMPDGSPRTLKDSVPFREVYIHALVRDADRQKMSKTKGNVIDPVTIVEKYGTDAVRFTLASMASPGTDIAFSEARTEGYRAFANKIWNAARFIFMNVERAREAGIEVSLEEASLRRGLHFNPNEGYIEQRWIASCLANTAGMVDSSLREYRFDEAASHIYQFFWGDFCDWYLEIAKIRLDFTNDADRDAQEWSLTTLLAVFESALRLLSPFMPFLTEELWHTFYASRPPAKSIALAPFPRSPDATLLSPHLMRRLQRLITEIRALRKEMSVPEGEFVAISLYGLGFPDQVEANKVIVQKLARVSEISFGDVPPGGPNVRSTPDFDVAVIYQKKIDVAAERERLTKELAKLEKALASAERQLSNPAFRDKAPPHVVEGLRKAQADNRLLIEKTRKALDDLPQEGLG